jgi:hypothetical protein
MAGNLNRLDAILIDAEGGGTTLTFDYTVTRGLEIVDVLVNTNTAPAGATTATVSRQALGAGGFTDVTDAMVVTLADDITRAGTIAAAQATCAATDVLRVTGSVNDISAEVSILNMPTTWIAG